VITPPSGERFMAAWILLLALADGQQVAAGLAPVPIGYKGARIHHRGQHASRGALRDLQLLCQTASGDAAIVQRHISGHIPSGIPPRSRFGLCRFGQPVLGHPATTCPDHISAFHSTGEKPLELRTGQIRGVGEFRDTHRAALAHEVQHLFPGAELRRDRFAIQRAPWVIHHRREGVGSHSGSVPFDHGTEQRPLQLTNVSGPAVGEQHPLGIP